MLAPAARAKGEPSSPRSSAADPQPSSPRCSAADALRRSRARETRQPRRALAGLRATRERPGPVRPLSRSLAICGLMSHGTRSPPRSATRKAVCTRWPFAVYPASPDPRRSATPDAQRGGRARSARREAAPFASATARAAAGATPASVGATPAGLASTARSTRQGERRPACSSSSGCRARRHSRSCVSTCTTCRRSSRHAICSGAARMRRA